MKKYLISRCNGQPNWSQIPMAPLEYPLEPTNADVTGLAQLCYDDEALYIRLSAQEAHIRATLTDPLSEVCEDSCLEFFFSPIADDPRYINIECNPNGCLFLGVGTSIDDLARLPNASAILFPQVQRIPGGWETVYAIPYSFVRAFFPQFSPVSGSTIRGNFYKCGDKTVIPHYLSWNPAPMQPFAFHNPAAFGALMFE